MDVPGYNYIKQNYIDGDHRVRPERAAVGTEETSGSGTRGKYATVREKGWMLSLNLNASKDTTAYAIERGWQFFEQRPWAAGLFYWTGFDYRGEPNPMSWPATGSQFGIFDYCGFPKDEAFYLRSWWTGDPVLHICGPVDGVVTVYSNMDEVTLWAGSRSLGRKKMPRSGHLSWEVGSATAIRAKGARKGGKALWADNSAPAAFAMKASKAAMAADGQDVVVVDITTVLPEEKLQVRIENAELLGWGNGDPGFKAVERPTGATPAGRNSLEIESFSHLAQLLVRSVEGSKGTAHLEIGGRTLEIALE